jgi:hypothetical protein
MVNGNPSSKALIFLASGLGVALLVIAFLVGRESARSIPADAEAVADPLPPTPKLEPEAEPDRRDETTGTRDFWRDRDEEYAYADDHWGDAGGIDQTPEGRIVLSNTRTEDEGKRDSADPPAVVKQDVARADGRAAVTAYFQQIDLIRSNAGAGDPNSFAMDMIKAGMGGATSGFDRLIADTDTMIQEIKRMTPPPSCMVYHQANLGALEEARAMLEGLKVAISTQDVQTLGPLAQQAANLQNKAESLKVLQEQIRASAR